MSHIRVLFFATLRDRAGVRSVDLDVPDQSTVAAVKHVIAERFPSLKEFMSHAIIAVNREYVFDASVIPGDAEVALFPPVSGG
jgi:MoaE-MoaD fusion protein